MNILILTHFLGRGGSSSLSVQVCNILRRNGHQVQILATLKTDDRVTDDAIFLFDRPYRSNSRAMRILLAEIKKLSPDLVYSISGTIEMEVLRFLSIPRIRHFSSLESHDALDIRHLFNQAKICFDGVTANTPDVIETLQAWSSGSTFLTGTFPYALNESLWEIPLDPPPAPSGQPIEICFIGRLEPYQKRADWLAEIINLTNQSRIPVEWHIYGDGPLKESLLEETKRLHPPPAVHFHGWLDQKELVSRLPAHDLFFLCSRWEGLPIAMVEAMLCGQACLVPDTCAGAGYALDSGGGWLYQANSPIACAAKLMALISKPELIHQERLLASTVAREKFLGPVPSIQSQNCFQMFSKVRFNGHAESIDNYRPYTHLPPFRLIRSHLLHAGNVIRTRITTQITRLCSLF